VKAESEDDGVGTGGATDDNDTTTVDLTTTTAVPDGSTSAADSTTTTETAETTVPEGETTSTAAEPTATTEPGTETTVGEYTNSPLADVTSPAEGETVDGDLTIAGRATYPGGLKHVEVVVKNLTTNLHWNPETEEFQTDWLRFPVTVDGPDLTDTAWSFTIPDAQLAPGEYLIRAWARGSQGEGDPLSASTNLRVS